jgi:hypothetical protein
MDCNFKPLALGQNQTGVDSSRPATVSQPAVCPCHARISMPTRIVRWTSGTSALAGVDQGLQIGSRRWRQDLHPDQHADIAGAQCRPRCRQPVCHVPLGAKEPQRVVLPTLGGEIGAALCVWDAAGGGMGAAARAGSRAQQPVNTPAASVRRHRQRVPRARSEPRRRSR